MFIPGGSAIPTTDYTLTNSLRFRSSASAYLSRTPGSAGNRQIWTWSAWVKRGALGSSDFTLLSAGTTAPTYDSFRFTNDALQFFQAGGSVSSVQTTQLFRDPSAWYHIVLSVDTTQATAANRVRIYVNGTQVTAFSSASYPAQNTSASINNNLVHAIGALWITSPQQYFDGYMDEINFIGGQALTPSSFGSTNPVTGVWQPARYTGTYGTNGYYLNFTNIALTSGSNTGLGQDFSGNGNFWNTNNISVTAGTTYDAMLDVPTLTSATVANYAVMNPLNSYSTITVNNANLRLTITEVAYRKAIATMAFPTSGLYYCEANLSGGISYVTYGIVTPEAPLNNAVGSTATGYGAITSGSQWDRWNNGTISGNFWNITTTNPTLQIAIDTTNGKLWLGYNNTWLDSSGGLTGNPSTGANATFTIDTARIYLPSFGGYLYDSMIINTNFGQRPFSYTPPTGFVALNTFNLPNSTIVKGNSYMNAVTYTGSASNVTVTSGFYPDLTWAKSRNNTYNHSLIDSNRGGDSVIFSNLVNAQSITSGLATFSSTGVTYLAGAGGVNADASTNYILWAWNAGSGTNTTNTAGSITTTTSVSTTAGFSIIKFTGTQANATIGHGLGVAPRMVIVKTYGGGMRGWRVYHASIGNTGYLVLNDTTTTTTDSTAWNNTTPTSTVISLGANAETNNGGSLMIAYAWAEIAGFSRFGSYTGNGSADGAFVYLGFRPAFVMLKNINTSDSWLIKDDQRAANYNPASGNLYPNLNIAEDTGSGANIDFLSNGFKVRGSNISVSGNGNTIIYAAFAENPFKNALAR